MLVNKKEPPYYNIKENTKYKIWEGKFKSNGTSAPIVYVYRNDFEEEITWSRAAAGVYVGAIGEMIWDENKTFIDCSDMIVDQGTTNDVVYQAYKDSNGIVIITYITGYGPNDGAINLNSWLNIRVKVYN